MIIDNKKTVSVLVASAIVLVSLSPISALPARAQWTVFDPANFGVNTNTSAQATANNTKDFGLDAVAWALANIVLERMTASTVNWVNSGFQGGPAYITNPESYYRDLGDSVAGQYIFSNPDWRFLCSPIQARIRLALARNYVDDGRIWQCTLSDVVGNIDNFMDDFSQGGWDGFFELTQKPQNNPIGAYLQAENELNLRLADKQKNLSDELNRGSGILSYKRCTSYHPKYNTCLSQGVSKEQCEKWYCESYETLTPGSVIQNQLNDALGTGNSRLKVADEINEIVSALLNQLLQKVVGGVSGLLGASERSPETNNKSITEQLLTDTQNEGYFGDTQNTTIPTVNTANLNTGNTETTQEPTSNTTVPLSASLTVNGSHSIKVPAGTAVNYQWSSTKASSGSASLAISAPISGFPVSQDLCGNSAGPFPSISGTSGSLSNTISAACQAGYTYTFTYTVTDANGNHASDTATVTVE